MTREEFYAKYGEVEVVFTSYYKFTFIYSALLPDNRMVNVSYGGNSDDIYRHSVGVGVPIKIKDLEPHSGSVYDGFFNEVDSFYDY